MNEDFKETIAGIHVKLSALEKRLGVFHTNMKKIMNINDERAINEISDLTSYLWHNMNKTIDMIFPILNQEKINEN